MHDLEFAKELYERNVKAGVGQYFDFVVHRLNEAITSIQRNEDDFKKTGNHRAIQNTVDVLSRMDLGYGRACLLIHRLAILEEDVFILELDKEEKEEKEQEDNLTIEEIKDA